MVYAIHRFPNYQRCWGSKIRCHSPHCRWIHWNRVARWHRKLGLVELPTLSGCGFTNHRSKFRILLMENIFVLIWWTSLNLQPFDSLTWPSHLVENYLCPRFMRCSFVCFPKLKPSWDKKGMNNAKKINFDVSGYPFALRISSNARLCWSLGHRSILSVETVCWKNWWKGAKECMCVCGCNQHHVMTWLEFVSH